MSSWPLVNPSAVLALSTVFGSVKKLVSHVRKLGEVSVTDAGILQRCLPSGDMVALQQFRDNLMVASKGPTPHSTMYPVCMTMESIWNLRVLCLCRDKDPEVVCRSACMTNRVRCMGVSIYVSPVCTLARAHPNASDAVWRLKFGTPMWSP